MIVSNLYHCENKAHNNNNNLTFFTHMSRNRKQNSLGMGISLGNYWLISLFSPSLQSASLNSDLYLYLVTIDYLIQWNYFPIKSHGIRVIEPRLQDAESRVRRCNWWELVLAAMTCCFVLQPVFIDKSSNRHQFTIKNLPKREYKHFLIFGVHFRNKDVLFLCLPTG